MHIKHFLVKINVIQVVSNELRHKNGLKRLGSGCFEAHRLNPLNPISYIIVASSIPVILAMYGFCGFFEKAFNPFKWD